MSARDLFPELLPANYADADDARALAWGMVSDWFGTLSYAHSVETHSEILDSLAWAGMPKFVRDASLHTQDEPIDYDDFVDGIRHQAMLARRAGLVVAAGKPRPRGGGGAAVGAGATGDLFSDDESGRGA